MINETRVKQGFRDARKDIDGLKEKIAKLIKSHNSIIEYLEQEKEGCRLVANTRENTLHIKRCPLAKKISDVDKAYFATKEQAEILGFETCGCVA